MVATKEKRTKKIAILSIVIAVMLLLSGCSLFRITKANYDKIETGMSFEEVVDILGTGYEASSDSNYGSCYSWTGLTGSITVTFSSGGYVTTKSQYGLIL